MVDPPSQLAVDQAVEKSEGRRQSLAYLLGWRGVRLRCKTADSCAGAGFMHPSGPSSEQPPGARALRARQGPGRGTKHRCPRGRRGRGACRTALEVAHGWWVPGRWRPRRYVVCAEKPRELRPYAPATRLVARAARRRGHERAPSRPALGPRASAVACTIEGRLPTAISVPPEVYQPG
jgi:hypothetical protein